MRKTNIGIAIGFSFKIPRGPRSRDLTARLRKAGKTFRAMHDFDLRPDLHHLADVVELVESLANLTRRIRASQPKGRA